MKVWKDILLHTIEENDTKMIVLDGTVYTYILIKNEEIIAILEDDPPHTAIILTKTTQQETLKLFQKLYTKYLKTKGYTQQEIQETIKQLNKTEPTNLTQI